MSLGIKTYRSDQNGFTLLEVLIVLVILGLITAMIVPAVGFLDDRKRSELTLEGMQVLRRAIVGPEDRFDAQGQPLVGGYVGDLHAWPDLWEARAEIKPDFSGTGWEVPDAMTPGLGQGPVYTMEASQVFFRPSGHFIGKNWRWYRPYRRLYDDTANHADHIGGLETENEGQPRGLWSRYPEDLHADLPDYPAPGLDLGLNWQGPYINPPLDNRLSDSRHWAESDDDYAALEPVWIPVSGYEAWEDGDYSPTPVSPGEFFDDKESFRQLQGNDRFVDGWDRSLRFFITADPDASGETIFWILSEGPDGAGEYPNKGTCSSHVWAVDVADIMSMAYNPDAVTNRDNLVLKLYSRDWRALLAVAEQQKISMTNDRLELIRRALVGDAPTGLNSGFTGDQGRYPRLFHWEGSNWDNENTAALAYTQGQPRGLWSAQPNSADNSDDLPSSVWGLGWRRAYLAAPVGHGEEELLLDAWGRNLLFFADTVQNSLLVLSRGADGRFDFGDTDTLPVGSPDGNNDYLDSADPAAVFSIATYNSLATQNLDNVVLRIGATDWLPAYFRMTKVTVLDASVGDPVSGTTRVAFFRDTTLTAGIDLLTATTLVDADGDSLSDDWVEGDGTIVNPAFNYDDLSSDEMFSGARYLVIWNDVNGNQSVDSGEPYRPLIYNLMAVAGSGLSLDILVNTADFVPAP